MYFEIIIIDLLRLKLFGIEDIVIDFDNWKFCCQIYYLNGFSYTYRFPFFIFLTVSYLQIKALSCQQKSSNRNFQNQKFSFYIIFTSPQILILLNTLNFYIPHQKSFLFINSSKSKISFFLYLCSQTKKWIIIFY